MVKDPFDDQLDIRVIHDREEVSTIKTATVASGEVSHDACPKHRCQRFLALLALIDRSMLGEEGERHTSSFCVVPRWLCSMEIG